MDQPGFGCTGHDKQATHAFLDQPHEPSRPGTGISRVQHAYDRITHPQRQCKAKNVYMLRACNMTQQWSLDRGAGLMGCDSAKYKHPIKDDTDRWCVDANVHTGSAQLMLQACKQYLGEIFLPTCSIVQTRVLGAHACALLIVCHFVTSRHMRLACAPQCIGICLPPQVTSSPNIP